MGRLLLVCAQRVCSRTEGVMIKKEIARRSRRHVQARQRSKGCLKGRPWRLSPGRSLGTACGSRTLLEGRFASPTAGGLRDRPVPGPDPLRWRGTLRFSRECELPNGAWGAGGGPTGARLGFWGAGARVCGRSRAPSLEPAPGGKHRRPGDPQPRTQTRAQEGSANSAALVTAAGPVGVQSGSSGRPVGVQ